MPSRQWRQAAEPKTAKVPWNLFGWWKKSMLHTHLSLLKHGDIGISWDKRDIVSCIQINTSDFCLLSDICIYICYISLYIYKRWEIWLGPHICRWRCNRFLLLGLLPSILINKPRWRRFFWLGYHTKVSDEMTIGGVPPNTLWQFNIAIENGDL